jgi:hypothetical protein
MRYFCKSEGEERGLKKGDFYKNILTKPFNLGYIIRSYCNAFNLKLAGGTE